MIINVYSIYMVFSIQSAHTRHMHLNMMITLGDVYYDHHFINKDNS